MRTDDAEARVSAASTGEGGRNLPGTGAGAEVRTAAAGRTKPEALRLMEAAVERSNMLCAYERVVKNEGAPGVDGLTVAEFKPWLQAHWPSIRQALLAGEYLPAAVRKVDIPKPQGGVRTLGIPTVLDRQTLRSARGRSLKQVVEQLNPVLRGWVAYFRLTEVKGGLADLDGCYPRYGRPQPEWHSRYRG